MENIKDKKEKDGEAATLGNKIVATSSAIEALLDNLLLTCYKSDASAIHIYSSPKSITCFMEVGGRLEITGKKFSDKVLKELADFVKISANFEMSNLNQAQSGVLKLKNKSINLAYLPNAKDNTSHLILTLDGPLKPKSLEDLGMWGKTLEDLESVLDSGKGIILLDSKDQYTTRSLVASSLAYVNQLSRISSLIFDSSTLGGISAVNNDRIFTKIENSSKSLANQALSSNPKVVVFLDTVSAITMHLAKEQSALGKLVFVVTSEGAAAKSLKKVLDLYPENDIFTELKLVLSASPIQTISGSNGNYLLDKSLVARLEVFFGIDMPQSWRSIYSHAGIKSPEELLHLEFPVASERGGLTNLVEAFRLTDYLIRTLSRNRDLSPDTINQLASRSGMLTKREDGLIKALRKEVDLTEVVDLSN